MNKIGDIFSSRARTEILRVLNDLRGGASLRQTARLAGVHPHSAELVLTKLAEERLVMSGRSGNRVIYKFNHKHEDVSVLEAVFRAVADVSIRSRSKTLQGRGSAVLPFINDALNMLKLARKDVDVA